jgi:hypothetical protein
MPNKFREGGCISLLKKVANKMMTTREDVATNWNAVWLKKSRENSTK